MNDIVRDELGAPEIVDRSVFEAELDALRVREKAHPRRRRDCSHAPAAADGRGGWRNAAHWRAWSGDAVGCFEGRRLLIAYTFMWRAGRPAPEQCEGCTWVTSQVRELSYIHSRDVTYATFCQGPYEEGARYRDFMGWRRLGTRPRTRSAPSWLAAGQA